MTRPVATPARSSDGTRRAEILQIAAHLFASTGFVRTSLKDVADACGILPGSLYHHFDSKESIAVELLRNYRAELDELAAAHAGDSQAPTAERVTALGVAIADRAVRHGAALQLSSYEPSAGATAELIELARQKPTAITTAMRRILEAGVERGEIHDGLDLRLLGGQLCETMLHVGLASWHREGAARQTAETLAGTVLYGLAVAPPDNATLDASAAMAAATAAVEGWAERDQVPVEDRRAVLRAVARVEFARRGYEATTIRDIARAAGMGIGSVYRLVDSKESLIASIMDAYHLKLSAGYDAVADSESSAVARLDALAWVNIRARDRFAEEFEIQRSWFRSTPPSATTLADSIEARIALMRDLVTTGLDHGEIRFTDTPVDLLARCVRDLIWLPPGVVGHALDRDLLTYTRDTMIRGALTPAGRG